MILLRFFSRHGNVEKLGVFGNVEREFVVFALRLHGLVFLTLRLLATALLDWSGMADPESTIALDFIRSHEFSMSRNGFALRNRSLSLALTLSDRNDGVKAFGHGLADAIFRLVMSVLVLDRKVNSFAGMSGWKVHNLHQILQSILSHLVVAAASDVVDSGVNELVLLL